MPGSGSLLWWSEQVEWRLVVYASTWDVSSVVARNKEMDILWPLLVFFNSLVDNGKVSDDMSPECTLNGQQCHGIIHIVISQYTQNQLMLKGSRNNSWLEAVLLDGTTFPLSVIGMVTNNKLKNKYLWLLDEKWNTRKTNLLSAKIWRTKCWPISDPSPSF